MGAGERDIPAYGAADVGLIDVQDIAFGADGTGYVVVGLGANPAVRATDLAPVGGGLGQVYRFTPSGGVTAFADVENQLSATRALAQQQGLRRIASEAADQVEVQMLNRYAGQPDGSFHRESLCEVRFVPLVEGTAKENEPPR